MLLISRSLESFVYLFKMWMIVKVGKLSQFLAALTALYLVNLPTRWSLLFILGFWYWSSQIIKKYSIVRCYSILDRVPAWLNNIKWVGEPDYSIPALVTPHSLTHWQFGHKEWLETWAIWSEWCLDKKTEIQKDIYVYLLQTKTRKLRQEKIWNKRVSEQSLDKLQWEANQK